MDDQDATQVLKKLTALAFSLNVVIDSGVSSSIPSELIYQKLKDGTILDYLTSEFRAVAGWGFSGWSVAEKRHLLGEWQSLYNVVDASRKFAVENNAICLLLAYTLEGIQMRLYEPSKTWPCPDPE